jgi:hypothetical protein
MAGTIRERDKKLRIGLVTVELIFF